MAKLVNVTCRRPIRLRNKLVRAIHREMLEAEEIFECIIQHGVVEEILEDGRTRILDFTNYNEEVTEEPKEEKEPTTTKKSGKKETKSEPKEDKETVTEPEVKPETETTPDETTEEDPKGPETKTEDVKENAEEKVAEAEEKAAKKSNKK